jgi:hypothetical protein
MNYEKPPIGVTVHPVTDNHEYSHPLLGIMAVFCFGAAMGFGIAMLAFAYAF